ncbi:MULTISPECIES: glycosyltransferase family 1 protein [Thermocrispum]|jgi:glycosyltransferase involved in cell wall biosynthesis|uniref:glycosyltransferase family 4 protein n=1 Tax=Thermocrispum TaxID=37924 RepID=UPI00041FE924|nr:MULTISPECIES: glycosyltransferase family 1 protein [Thermocrispum]
MPELLVIAEQLFAPVPGGTGRYTEQLIPALVATAPKGWTVGTVVCRHADVTRARFQGAGEPKVLRLPRRAMTLLWQYGVRYWPGGRDVAAVHAPTPFAPPAKPRGARLTVTVHDTVPWTHPETLTPRGVRWHKSVIARAFRVADAVVVPTRAVADDLRMRVGGPARIEVVPHAAADLFADPQAGHARPSDLPGRYLLAVGTIEPRKGIDVLIGALARLRSAGEEPPPLVLAGPQGWGGLDPLALAERRGLPTGAVRVLGAVPDAALAGTVLGATIVVVPSRAEGFGLPVLEAMAAGVPVVHSDVPALVEVGGGAGEVVPAGDEGALAASLRKLLGDQRRRAEMAAAGRRRAAEFSWQRTAEALWRLHTDASGFAGS